MQSGFFNSIHRFFHAAGRVVSTPSGDAHDHRMLPNGTMHEVQSGPRFFGQ